MKRWLALAAVAAVVAPTAASAADADARCVVLMNALAQNKAKPDQAAFANLAMIYYVGRMDGRGQSGQLKTLIETESKLITAATANADANRCAQQFQARGAQIRAMSGAPAAPAAKAGTPAPKAPAKK